MRRTHRPAHVPLAAIVASAVLVSAAAQSPSAHAQHDAASPASAYTLRSVALPGGGASGISMDYLAYDPASGFVWAPAGNTGAVDVVDSATGKVTVISGFATKEVETENGTRVLGPSSATVGRGVVYIGNRADMSVCAVNARSLARGACGHLDSMPDGLAYVAATSEVWVTTPRDHSIRILDASSLAEKAKLTFDGEPEGFAVDAKRGRFYTNLEDKDLTLAIELKSRKTVATWQTGCGEDGPHGLALDEKSGFLFVACSARVETLDVAHDGRIVSSIDTGDGVDAIDYAPATHKVYVGAAEAGQLVVASVDRAGHLTLTARVPTHAGARNGVVARDGAVYLAHTRGSGLSELVVAVPTK